MKTSQKLVPIGLLTLAGAAIVGLILTGSLPTTDVQSKGRGAPFADQAAAVDQQTLQTARKLAALAVTPEEQQLARDAVRVADRGMDLGFAIALRAANQQPGPRTGESPAIQERIQRTEAQVEENKEKLKKLTAQAATAKGSNQDSLRQQMELAQAELALDQDALADAKEDLARAGGDASGKLQRLWEEHEAAQHTNEAIHLDSDSGSPVQTVSLSAGLIARWHNWSVLRRMRAQLLQARQDALNAAATLARNHQALEEHVQAEQLQKQARAHQATSLLEAGKLESEASSKEEAAPTLSLLHHLSEDEKNLADLDKQIQDLRELGASYGQWSALVKSRQRTSLHDMIESALWIVLTCVFVFLAGRLIDHSFTHVTLERKQLVTLRAVARFVVQALGVLVILLVTFGSPNDMTTILGLAGAGLTVALKDFVVSFFGWFALMGRNGMRVGDWVEINGVRGEVIEIGLFRTVLLETGNWTEPGHPTGRRVSFLNSFAVEGHYFNFTTSGQWLWDEIKVLIPWGVDPDPIIEKIYDVVAKETGPNTQMAEQDWQRMTHRYGVKSLPAAPTVNVRSTEEGVEVVVRYITRANERYEVRSRLNHAAVKLIHRGKGIAPATETLRASSGAGSSK